jgi:hypothetical protein
MVDLVIYKSEGVRNKRKNICVTGLGLAKLNSGLGQFQNRPCPHDANWDRGPLCRIRFPLDQLPSVCRCRRVGPPPHLSLHLL